jgi:hypothetical protein
LAESYEGESNLPYSEDDAYTTAPNLMYVNQQAEEEAAQNALALAAKQNAIVMQPTSPPANPQLGDMWIDNNVFPNVIYTWNSVEWIKASVTTATEIVLTLLQKQTDMLSKLQWTMSQG